jgi:hypothetical protein
MARLNPQNATFSYGHRTATDFHVQPPASANTFLLSSVGTPRDLRESPAAKWTMVKPGRRGEFMFRACKAGIYVRSNRRVTSKRVLLGVIRHWV